MGEDVTEHTRELELPCTTRFNTTQARVPTQDSEVRTLRWLVIPHGLARQGSGNHAAYTYQICTC